jgi:hypothetical protein
MHRRESSVYSLALCVLRLDNKRGLQLALLYNGPPDKAPQHVKMLAFTSPNFDWLDSMHKDQNHARLYMPVWTLDELLHGCK